MQMVLNFNEKPRTNTKLTAIKIAKKYSCINNEGRIKVIFDNCTDELVKLLEYASGWKGTEFFVDNKETSINSVLGVWRCPNYSTCDGLCRLDNESDYKMHLGLFWVLKNIEERENENLAFELKKRAPSCPEIEITENGNCSVDRAALEKAVLNEIEFPLLICDKIEKDLILAEINNFPEDFSFRDDEFGIPTAKEHETDEFREKTKIFTSIFVKEMAKQLDDVLAIHFGPEEKIDDFIEKGDLLLAIEKFTKSIEYYRKALEYDPNCDFAWNRIGHAFFQEGNIENGINAYKQAIDIIPSDPLHWFDFANDLLIAHRYGEAIEAYLEAIRIEPGYTPSLHNIALAYELSEEYSKAREYLEKVLEIDPEDKEAIQKKRKIEENWLS